MQVRVLLSHSSGCFDASEYCTLFLDITLAQSSVYCALSHDDLCRETRSSGCFVCCALRSRTVRDVSIGCALVVCFPGGGETGSPPLQVQRLPLRRPRLPRRKRDCTLVLFLTSSASTSATSLCTSEEEGVAHSPFFLAMTRCTGITLSDLVREVQSPTCLLSPWRFAQTVTAMSSNLGNRISRVLPRLHQWSGQ